MPKAIKKTDTEFEIWQNASKGRAAVLKYDRFNKLTQELVNPGRTVQLSKEEREINQERAAASTLDLFTNGVLTPIRLVDPEDEKEFADNPNLMTDEDIRSMFAMQWRLFDEKLKGITNVYTLNRLLEVAKEEGSVATVRQASLVEEQLKSHTPEPRKLTSFADDRF